jgi:nucleoside-diphosphate-sugar epimerase
MVLVTGASGLLGSELVKQLLAAGKHVRAMYHRTKAVDLDHPNLEQVQGDILDVTGLGEIMKGVDELYHCAGLVSFTPGNAQQLYKINVEGTSNIVNAALDEGIKKMLHVSSVASLGRMRENELVHEGMQWTKATSNSKYGHSKYLGELEVWRGIAEGLDAVIVNPTVILGAGNWNDGSTEIFKSAYNEFPWYTDGISGFVDVRDVAKAMILLMGSGIVAERFIISAENTGYHDVFNMIAGAFNKKPPSRKVTPFLAGLIWRLHAIKYKFAGTIPLVTKETAATAMAKVNFDNSKLKKYLPSFAYHTISTTINETCAALQQKLNNH